MATTAPQSENARPVSGSDYQDVDTLVAERRRTESHRSRPGIPAANEIYCDLAFASSSQESSWETMSETSHSQSYSFVGSDANSSVEDHLLATTVLQAPMNCGIAQPPSFQNTNIPPGRWSGAQPNERIQSSSSLQPIQTRFSDHAGQSPDALSPPNVDYAHPGRVMSGGLHPPVAYGSTCEIMHFFSDSDLSPVSPGISGSSPGPFPPGSISPSHISDAAEPTSTPDIINPSFIVDRYSSGVSPAGQEIDVEWVTPPSSHSQKRKREDSTPSKQRPNLSEINDVREIGACIPCKLLHEKVRGPLIRRVEASIDHDTVWAW